MARSEKISSSDFYGEYYGHKVKHLQALYPGLRQSCDSLIWTAGDSSLDNKYWFDDPRPSVGEYANILDPPLSNADVTYWLNYISDGRGSNPVKRAAINTAVEASTVNWRTFRLSPQDRFLRDNIAESDVLVVSVGGNDVAFTPVPCTVLSVLGLKCMPMSVLERSFVFGTVPVSLDDCTEDLAGSINLHVLTSE